MMDDAFYAAMVESSDDAIISMDPHGIVRTWNPAAEALYGYTADEMIGQEVSVLIPKEGLATLHVSLERLRAGEGLRQDHAERCHRDGTRIPVSSTLSPVYDEGGEVIGISSIERDAREPVAQREALAASESRLRAIFDCAAVGIAEVAVDGRWLRMNECMCEILGYTREELRTLTYHDVTHPDDLPTDERLVDQCLAGEISSYTMEKRYVRKEGGTLWALLTVTLVRDTNGQPAYFVSVVDDISGRKQLEQDLRMRTEEVRATNEELESFTYSVTHDLRAPARAVASFSQILGEEHSAQLDAEGRRLLGVVRNSAARMEQLIDDLLEFSRLGRKPMEMDDVDMDALARRVGDDVVAACPDRNIELSVEALPRARGDASLLTQVWTNLLDNAVKYSRDADPAVIEVTSRTEGGRTLYQVSDNGVGFDMRYVDKLFGVFQRLHANSEFAGTGVGLALVHRIITRHGGTIRARAEPGKGASFTFALEPGQAEAAPAAPGETSGNR